jgi:hypothetical protein
MAEAKRMMADPQFQKQMKELQNSKEFKQSLQQTKDLLQDPNQAAKAEAKLETMAKIGQEQLKDQAGASMEAAMQAALTNPEVMAEMTKMLKDPSFARQLEAMTKDPQFRMYQEAMKDMLKDPAKKAQLDAATQQIKAKLA